MGTPGCAPAASCPSGTGWDTTGRKCQVSAQGNVFPHPHLLHPCRAPPSAARLWVQGLGFLEVLQCSQEPAPFGWICPQIWFLVAAPWSPAGTVQSGGVGTGTQYFLLQSCQKEGKDRQWAPVGWVITLPLWGRPYKRGSDPLVRSLLPLLPIHLQWWVFLCHFPRLPAHCCPQGAIPHPA